MILNCRGTLHEFDGPIVMGILNLTPDSFYDGGKFTIQSTIVSQIDRMISEGAQIIDVGAMSSRPAAKLLSEKEELARLLPVLSIIKSNFPETLISIDTFNSEVVRACYDEGADILNDISGGSWDLKLFETVGELRMPYILMHIFGSFETMHDKKEYGNIIMEMMQYFVEKIRMLRQHGIQDIILDPGFGFSKSLENNFEVLQNLNVFKILDLPILAGISRKSMICKTLKISPDQALNGTTALNMLALQRGAKILRVHDVKEALETIELHKKFTNPY